jgi:Rrf2 family nitric oxide-sensitive transcriptional repressor
MQLTLYTDYGLRVLIYLATEPDRRVTVGEVAESYGVSHNHLVKVVQELVELGYIETVRGRGGGMQLLREPADIRVGDVVRQLEPTLDLLKCLGDGECCPITPVCVLRKVLTAARDQFIEALDQYSLEDLTANRSEIQRLLDFDSIA